MTAQVQADVAVIGSGLAGSMLAISLARAGVSVALVEARAPAERPAPEPFDLRVYALSLGSVRYLDQAGVWGRMVETRREPFREMHVWDAASPGEIHFDAAALGAPTLGYVVEDWAVQRALESALAASSQVQWIRPARLQAVHPGPEAVRAVLDTGSVEARLLVGADGFGLAVRGYLGIESVAGSYGQTAVVATVRTERDHRQTAWQRFLPGGPLAFLPLPGRFSSIVWSVPETRAEDLLGLDDAAFQSAIELASDYRLGAVECMSRRVAFPLNWRRVSRYVGPRTALIGDAAHTIHPLAGQGINLGLMDAASLAELVAGARARGNDLGSRHVLRRYERWRKAHNRYVERAMEALLTLFAQTDPGWRSVRGLGLGLTDRLPLVKGLLGGLAMGLTGDLPASYTARPDPPLPSPGSRIGA